LRIAWSVSHNGNGHELRFRWEEHGGPPVVVPTREGFGSTLLKTAFAKTGLDYAPDGFCCEIEANVRLSTFGGKADVGIALRNVRFHPNRTFTRLPIWRRIDNGSQPPTAEI
jgi:hypothetical protein